MTDWLARMKERPWVAHLLRAVGRFLNRLGNQFGAAITYFSVLAMVPILLFSFAVAGFILTVSRPDLLNGVAQSVASALGGTDPATQQGIRDLIDNALGNWRGVGIVGLLSAVYAGAGWMGNLKNAVRAQWRPHFDLQEAPGNIVKQTLLNLATLVGLVLLIAVTFGLASVSTSLTTTVLDLLGLAEVGWLRPVFQLVPIVFSIGAGWLLFVYLYTVLPQEREPWPVVRRGAFIGAIGLGLLQYLTSFLFGQFGNNAAAQIFGPVITLMLFFNLFARLILFMAAWIATADHEAVPELQQDVRFPFVPLEQDGRDDSVPAAIPQHIAARSVQVGLGAGYVTGAATGVGLGAALAWVLSSAVRARR